LVFGMPKLRFSSHRTAKLDVLTHVRASSAMGKQ
jgi:hypothetical protein